MEHLEDEGASFRFALVESADLWRAGAVVLGLSLWAQLYWYPVAAEFLSGRVSPLYVGVYLLPTLVLFVSMFAEGAAGFLFFVPVSLIPGLVMLPQRDVGNLLEPSRALFAAGTLLAFLFAGALSSRSATGDQSREGTEELEGEARWIDGLYRHYFGVRFSIAAILFGILVGAVLFDPSLTSAIAEHHDEGRVSAQLFLLVFGFFTWCVLAYTMFFLPAANLEYDVRRLSREIGGLPGGTDAIRWRLGAVVGGGGLVVGLFFGWKFLF